MSTSSRRLSQRSKSSRPSQTPGKQKSEACQKTDLKEWGRQAKPWAFGSGDHGKYEVYCKLTDSYNNSSRSG